MPKVVKGHVAFEPRRHVYSLQDAVCYVLLEIDQELKYHEVLENMRKDGVQTGSWPPWPFETGG